MNTDTLKEKITRLVTGTGKDLETTKQTLASLSETELFIWLGEQDSSLLYQLALELDIPLQHLEHTCKTLKQIHGL